MYNVLFIIGWIIYFSFTVACPVTVIYASIKNWPARRFNAIGVFGLAGIFIGLILIGIAFRHLPGFPY